jgi:hypothetical protein
MHAEADDEYGFLPIIDSINATTRLMKTGRPVRQCLSRGAEGDKVNRRCEMVADIRLDWTCHNCDALRCRYDAKGCDASHG